MAKMGSKRVLLIRADADEYKGAGHVMRCLALAQGWQDIGGRAIFLSRLPEAIANRLTVEGMELLPIAASCPDPIDLIQTLEVAEFLGAGRLKGTQIVLDGYHFTTAYQQKLYQAGLQTLVVDDYGHLPAYYAAWLLNQNPWANTIKYIGRLNANCCVLSGLNFALLRREFGVIASSLARPHCNAGQCKVLVTMGGADATNVTGLVVEALATARVPNLTCTIIIGPAYGLHHALKTRFATTGLVGEVLTHVTDMAKWMAQADIAVTAGGSTCWELACLGLPMLILALADNQIRTGPTLAVTGAAIDLGRLKNTQAAQNDLSRRIRTELIKLLPNVAARAAMSVACRQLVDGRGASRVATALWGVDKL